MVNCAYKIELDPTKKQVSQFIECAGIARYSWNWSLGDRIERYRNNTGNDRYTTAINQNKELTKLKNTQLPWMRKYSKTIHQNEIRNLEQAFQNFFNKTHRFPRFKKKSKSKDSFRLTSTIRILTQGKRTKSHGFLFTAPRIQLPGLKTIRIKELPDLKASTIITSATVSRAGNRWFVSLTCTEEKHSEKSNQNGSVGIDLGLIDLAITSDKEHFDNPKPLKKALKKLRRLNKELSRRDKYSKNWFRTVEKINKLHFRIKSIRNDTLGKLTTYLVRNYETIVIEDLHVKGMMKNRKLSRAIADVGWGELRRQLEYKSSWYGSELIVAPRFFPSSKLRSGCWNKKNNLFLSDRIYRCDHCGLTIDRDENAALNLKIFGLLHKINPSVADSWTETLNACGEYISPSDGDTLINQMMRAVSMKHEDPRSNP